VRTHTNRPSFASVRFWMAALALSTAACSGGGSSSSAASTETATSAGGEQVPAAYAGPITSTDIARGKERFEDLCGDCHPDGGADSGPSLIADPHSAGYIRQQTREGSGKMRPIPERRLSNEDLEAILAWLASVKAVKQ
jgi:mono/diheme cytochrome c family protein